MNAILKRRSTPVALTSRLPMMLVVVALIGSGVAAVSLATASPAFAALGAASQLCKPADQMTGDERRSLPQTYVISCTRPSANRASASPGQPVGVYSHSGGFSFSNSNIAWFSTDYRWVNRYNFELRNVQLKDTGCDARAVFADVYDQNGWLGEFKNGKGCNTTAKWAGPINFGDLGGVAWFYVRLYACNSWGCSSYTSSSKKYNPHY